MKIDFMPFQIGMQYENWEFDLEILPDRINGFDSYRYVGDKFNENIPDDIELIFNLDILEVVIFTYTKEAFQYHIENGEFTKIKISDNFDKILVDNSYFYIYYSTDIIYVILVKDYLLSLLLSSLIC